MIIIVFLSGSLLFAGGKEKGEKEEKAEKAKEAPAEKMEYEYVKWYDDGPLTVKAERERGKQGKFFSGKVVGFNSQKKVYRIAYDDDVDGIYETNLTVQSRGDFIPKANWRT